MIQCHHIPQTSILKPKSYTFGPGFIAIICFAVWHYNSPNYLFEIARFRFHPFTSGIWLEVVTALDEIQIWSFRPCE